jgi:hypothetical protein
MRKENLLLKKNTNNKNVEYYLSMENTVIKIEKNLAWLLLGCDIYSIEIQPKKKFANLLHCTKKQARVEVKKN